MMMKEMTQNITSKLYIINGGNNTLTLLQYSYCDYKI